QPQAPALFRLAETLLLVARRNATNVGLDPDLQEVHAVPAGGIELAVPDAGARAHALHVTGPDARAIAERVLVRQLAFQHVADDLHVAVAVRAKSLAGRDAVFVDDPQGTELDVLRVEIVRE